MAIPTSKPLSLSAVQTEYGGTNPISMSEYRSKGNAPATGAIDLWADFNGTSAVITGTQSGVLLVGEADGFYNSRFDTYYGPYNSPSAGGNLPTGFTNNTSEVADLQNDTTLGGFVDFPFRRGIKARIPTSTVWVDDAATITNLTKLEFYLYLDSNTETDGYGNADSRHYMGYYTDRSWGANNVNALLGGSQGLDAGGGTLEPTFSAGSDGLVGYDVLTTLGQTNAITFIKKGLPTYIGLEGEETGGYNDSTVSCPAGRPYKIYWDVQFDYEV